MSPPRALVVDDQRLNLELAEFVLRAEGFKVLTVDSAAEATAVMRSFRPHIVLMDLQMPEVDGLTAMRQIKANPAFATIKIIAFTAYAMAGDRDKFLSEGFDGYIAKPIDVMRLAGDVLAYLD